MSSVWIFAIFGPSSNLHVDSISLLKQTTFYLYQTYFLTRNYVVYNLLNCWRKNVWLVDSRTQNKHKQMCFNFKCSQLQTFEIHLDFLWSGWKRCKCIKFEVKNRTKWTWITWNVQRLNYCRNNKCRNFFEFKFCRVRKQLQFVVILWWCRCETNYQRIPRDSKHWSIKTRFVSKNLFAHQNT